MHTIRRLLHRRVALSLIVGVLVTAACSADSSGDADAATGSGSSASSVHGVTDDTIEIGIATVDAEAAGTAVEGIGGDGGALEQGTSYTQSAQAVIDHINENGGVAGRQIVPVFYNVDAESATTRSGRSQEQQRACAHWTEDHEVFAVLGWVVAASLDCAERTDTIFVGDILSGGQESMSAAMFEEYGHIWFSVNGMTAERRDRNLVEALAEDGWFTDDARVGILVEDRDGSQSGVENGMVPVLEELDIDAVQVVYPDGIEAQWPNYVVQLQQEEVTHILFAQSEANAYSVSLAQTAAETQQYRPQWAIASDLMPRSLVELGAPSVQLANTIGIGWVPALDTEPDDGPESATGSTCDEIAETSGQPYAAIYCDALFFLKHAAEQATEISPEGIRQAVAELGTTHESSATLGGATSFGPDRHDGASSYRVFTFDESCGDGGCFTYTGPERPLS